jgi:hypothetical protein
MVESVRIKNVMEADKIMKKIEIGSSKEPEFQRIEDRIIGIKRNTYDILEVCKFLEGFLYGEESKDGDVTEKPEEWFGRINWELDRINEILEDIRAIVTKFRNETGKSLEN